MSWRRQLPGAGPIEPLRDWRKRPATRMAESRPQRGLRSLSMKVGEALTLRSQLQIRFQLLLERLKASALVQEGGKPPEDPKELLKDLEGVAQELESLVARINRTNLATTLGDNRTLTDALARREYLGRLQGALHQVAETASSGQARYSKSEIRILRVVDVGELRRRADDLAKERRELDARIQEANWQTELMG